MLSSYIIMSDFALSANKANSLYSKALSSGFPRSTSPMLAMPSPPMSPYSRLASTTPSSPGSLVEDSPATTPARLATPSFDHVHPLKRFTTAQPHYKLPTPTPPPSDTAAAPIEQPSTAAKTFRGLPSAETVLRTLAEPARPPPQHEFGNYRLESFNPAAPLISCCWDSLKKNPRRYLARERALLANYSRHGPSSRNYHVTAHSSVRKQAPQQQQRSARVYRRAMAGLYGSESESMATRSKKRPEISGLASPAPSSSAYSRPVTPRPAGYSSAASSRPGTPKPPRAPKPRATTTTNNRVHDLNASQLVDYSPPVSSLPVGKSLRAEWKGAPMDLSDDPNLHLLHAAEVHLAAVLRLPADVYLDSKKRLFAEKVHRLKQGLPFRRTDSQKACRIDVNKASRLFSAYEKVGWLEDSLFTKFL